MSDKMAISYTEKKNVVNVVNIEVVQGLKTLFLLKNVVNNVVNIYLNKF